MPPELSIKVNRPDLGFSQLPVPSNELHVSTAGSDETGDGSQSRPYRTLQVAMDHLATPGVIRVRAGTYTAKSVGQSILKTSIDGTADNPCWLIAEPGVRLVAPDNKISGGQLPDESGIYRRNQPFLRINHSFWIVEGFELDGGRTHWNAVTVDPPEPVSHPEPDVPPPPVKPPHHVVLKDLLIHDFTGNNAISLHRAQDIAVLGGKVHSSRRWAWVEKERTFKITSQDPGAEDSHGIYVDSGCSQVLIRGVESYENGGDSVQCNQENDGAVPSHITIEGNRMYRDFENAVDLKTCDYVAVRANKMYGYRDKAKKVTERSPSGAALVAHANAQNVVFEKNRVWDCTSAATLGAKNGRLGNIVFRRNLVFDASAVQPETPDLEIGFGIYASHVSHEESSRIEIYNNTFYNIPCYAIYVGTNEEDAGDTVNHAVVVNNIVAEAGYGLNGRYAMRFEFQAGTLTRGIKRLECNRNLYYNSRTPERFRIQSTLGTPEPYEELVRGEDGYVTTGGQPGWTGTGRHDTESFIDDPRFIDRPRYNDFYTEEGSKAWDNAERTPEHTLEDVPFCGKEPDIGFLETC